MEKECCNVKVTEIDNGFRVEITGKEIKEKCRDVMENCRMGGKPWKEFLANCCSSNA
ncbi:MAG: hypothetical protein HZA01_02555 [Nitrospinae bacterium]|nr:hypothetical protein [Nitrospinota bacterium]